MDVYKYFEELQTASLAKGKIMIKMKNNGFTKEEIMNGLNVYWHGRAMTDEEKKKLNKNNYYKTNKEVVERIDSLLRFIKK